MICRERPERGGLGQGDFERAELAGGFRRSRECLGWAGLQGKVQPRAGSVGLGNGEGGSGKSQRKHKGRKNIPRELPTRSERIVKRKMGKRFGEKKVVLPSKGSSSLGAPGKGREKQPGAFGLMPSSCSAARPGDEFSG